MKGKCNFWVFILYLKGILLKFRILVSYLWITVTFCDLNFEKIYALFGVNFFPPEIMLCKVLDIYNVCPDPPHPIVSQRSEIGSPPLPLVWPGSFLKLGLDWHGGLWPSIYLVQTWWRFAFPSWMLPIADAHKTQYKLCTLCLDILVWMLKVEI